MVVGTVDGDSDGEGVDGDSDGEGVGMSDGMMLVEGAYEGVKLGAKDGCEDGVTVG